MATPKINSQADYESYKADPEKYMVAQEAVDQKNQKDTRSLETIWSDAMKKVEENKDEALDATPRINSPADYQSYQSDPDKYLLTQAASNYYNADVMAQQKAAEEAAKNSQEFQDAINVDALSSKLGVDKSMIIDDFHMTELEKQQNVYLKTDLSDQKTIKKQGGKRIDNVSASSKGNAVEVMDGVKVWRTTKGWPVKSTRVHVNSDYLGNFEYDPDDFTLGYKEIKEKDGSVSKLPVLEYTGDGDGISGAHSDDFDWFGLADSKGTIGFVGNSDPKIPDGLKSADYMFANNTNMHHVPKLPNSITSMHCMFKNCTNLKDMAPDASAVPGQYVADYYNWLNLPDDLQDMSYAFSGCKNLTCGFPDGDISENCKVDGLGMPTDLRNIKSAWEGCENVGKEGSYWFFGDIDYQYRIPEYGGVATPYLTSEYAKDALNKITNEKVKDAAKNAEFLVNDDGSVNQDVAEKAKKSDALESHKEELQKSGAEIDEETGLDKNALQESITETGLRHQEQIFDGIVRTNTQLRSNSQLTNNYVYNSATDQITDDKTGLRVSDSKRKDSIWQRLAIDGLAGLGIFGVAKGTTKSTILGAVAGVGGVYLLDRFDVLPESFSPVLRFTAKWLPDCSLKTKLTDLADNLSGSVSYMEEQDAMLTDENVAMTLMPERLQNSLYAVDSADVQSLNTFMYNNGKTCGEDMAFKSLADAGEDAASCVSDTVKKATDAMQSQWDERYTNNPLSESDKQAMQYYYTNLIEGLSEYNKGAKAGYAKLSADDKTASEEGLKMTNRAYVSMVLDSLKEMDGKYHFMNTDTWTKLDHYDISGIDSLSTYSDTQEQQSRSESKAIVDELHTHDNYIIGTDVDPYMDKIHDGTYEHGEYERDQNTQTQQTDSDTQADKTKDRSSMADAYLDIQTESSDQNLDNEAN